MSKKKILWSGQRFTCFWCNDLFREKQMSIEHLVPVCLLNRVPEFICKYMNSRINLRLACKDCNNTRGGVYGDAMHSEFWKESTFQKAKSRQVYARFAAWVKIEYWKLGFSPLEAVAHDNIYKTRNKHD